MKVYEKVLLYAIAEELGINLKKEINKIMEDICFPDIFTDGFIYEEHHPVFGSLMFIYRDDKWHLVDK
jgi:hypothetical protein